MTTTTTNDQLEGKYRRLRVQLAAAYGEPYGSLGRTGRIDRLARDLADIESAWMRARVDEGLAIDALAERRQA